MVTTSPNPLVPPGRSHPQTLCLQKSHPLDQQAAPTLSELLHPPPNARVSISILIHLFLIPYPYLESALVPDYSSTCSSLVSVDFSSWDASPPTVMFTTPTSLYIKVLLPPPLVSLVSYAWRFVPLPSIATPLSSPPRRASRLPLFPTPLGSLLGPPPTLLRGSVASLPMALLIYLSPPPLGHSSFPT